MTDESEYHFVDDLDKKRKIFQKLMPVIEEARHEFGFDYVVAFHLAGIAAYLRMRDIKGIISAMGNDLELSVSLDRIKKPPV